MITADLEMPIRCQTADMGSLCWIHVALLLVVMVVMAGIVLGNGGGLPKRYSGKESICQCRRC